MGTEKAIELKSTNNPIIYCKGCGRAGPLRLIERNQDISYWVCLRCNLNFFTKEETCPEA